MRHAFPGLPAVAAAHAQQGGRAASKTTEQMLPPPLAVNDGSRVSLGLLWCGKRIAEIVKRLI